MIGKASSRIEQVRDWIEITFSAHPHRAGETYFQHMKISLGICGTLLKLALSAFIHAVVPSKHERTVSRGVMDLYSKILKR